MVLDKIPNTILFAKRDVRETPISTATATSVGLTDLNYVLLSTDADTTRDRVITAGEGIDFTDAGIKSTLTISGENASTTNKGIASFDASDFDTAAGVVTIDDSGVDHNATGNYTVTEHRVWENSIAQNIHADNYTNTGDTTYTPGEGINIVEEVISGEDASEGNKGIIEIATINEVQTGTDTDRAVVPNSLQVVIPPVGAIIAWAKTIAGVPQTLPAGWRLCNGSTINDAESPMNGEDVPDLNGGEFLRGAETSGATGGSETMAHTHTGTASGTTGSHTLQTSEIPAHTHIEYKRTGASSAPTGSGGTTYNEGSQSVNSGSTGGGGGHTHSFSDGFTTSAASNTENRPKYFNVVWIIRFK